MATASTEAPDAAGRDARLSLFGMHFGGNLHAPITEPTKRPNRHNMPLQLFIARAGDPANAMYVPRSRVSPAYLQEIFHCGAIEALVEEGTETVVWPARWISECAPAPKLYYINEVAPPEVMVDALEDDEYRGEVLVLIRNVPGQLAAAGLTTWLNHALEDEHSELATTKNSVDDLIAKLEVINKQIQLLPNASSERADDAREELESRRKRAALLEQIKADTEAKLAGVQAKLSQLSGEVGDGVKFELEKFPKLDAAGQATWIITFQNTDEGQELEYIATHKTNWGEYFLLYLADANEYVTGKGVPEDTSGYEDMYMKDIRIDRVRHGRGFLRFSDERGFYSGDWRHGIMHGQGTQINALGRYQGGFEEGLCSGNATMVFSRGDTYTGEYRAPSFHSHTSLLGGAEYLEGLPHGTGAMRFTDGSCYDGGFELGSPAGIGKYTCVTGAGKEGEFSAWSGLHGEGSETMDDVTRIGNFRTGGMHRFGTEIDMKVGTYDGDFECGMRHGFGVSESRVVRGTYVGSYFLGQRTGRGILDLSTPPTDDAEQEQAKKTIAAKLREAAEAVNRTRRVVIPSDGEYRFEGRWLNNRPRQRGVFTMRNGSVSPLKFSFLWTIDGNNHHLPLLVDMAAAEERLDTERGALIRVLTKSVLDQRKAKESGNLAKYNVFMSLAHTRMLDVIMRNRALQAGVRGVVFRLKEKQESAARAAQALAAALKEDSSSSGSGGGASAPNASGEGGAGMNVGSS